MEWLVVAAFSVFIISLLLVVWEAGRHDKK